MVIDTNYIEEFSSEELQTLVAEVRSELEQRAAKQIKLGQVLPDSYGGDITIVRVHPQLVRQQDKDKVFFLAKNIVFADDAAGLAKRTGTDVDRWVNLTSGGDEDLSLG